MPTTSSDSGVGVGYSQLWFWENDVQIALTRYAEHDF